MCGWIQLRSDGARTSHGTQPLLPPTLQVYLTSKKCEATTNFIGLYNARSSLLPTFLPNNDPLWLVCPGAKPKQRRSLSASRKEALP